jgi:hypothetical protein
VPILGDVFFSSRKLAADKCMFPRNLFMHVLKPCVTEVAPITVVCLLVLLYNDALNCSDSMVEHFQVST